uniref:PmoR n=1 Tax=Mycobacterium sp. M156 TaxID=263548 RepID=Q5QJ55_9MYCO|nr:PmoR [Mycobacterium sp. M156]
MAKTSPAVDWPQLVADLLADDPDDVRSVEATLTVAAQVSSADNVLLVEWVRGRPSVLHAVGDPVPLFYRPSAGATHLAGRPITSVALDAHRDLLAVRAPGAAPFLPSDLPALQAIAALLVRSQSVGRKEAAEALYRLSLDVVGTLDLDRVLLSTATAASRLLQSEVAGVFLVHGQGSDEELRMQCAIGNRTVDTARLRIPRGHGIAGKVLECRRPVRVDDYATTSTISLEYLPTAMAEGTQSGLGVPMYNTSGDIMGVLAVWRRRPSVFSDEDEEFLNSLAGLAAIGVTNARLYQQQLDSTRDLQAMQRELEARLHISGEALEIHQRLTEIAAEGLDLSALAQAVHEMVTGRIVIVPEGDRAPVAWPPHIDSATETHIPPQAPSKPVHDMTAADYTDESGQWVSVPIKAANVRHGQFYALLAQPPTIRDVVILEQAATICALLLGHEESLVSSTERLRSEFIWDLFDGRITSEADIISRALALGFRLAFPARIMLLRAQGFERLVRSESWSAEETERARNWISARIATAIAERTGDVVPVAHRSEHFVAILTPAPAGQTTSPAAIAKAAVARSPYPSVSLQVGVSRAVNSIEALPGALREARVALSAVTPERGPVVVLDDLGVLQFLIAPTQAQDLYRYAQAILGPLVSYDERHGSDLVATLDHWFNNGCNSAQTARNLQLHTKSLTYRLHRIAEISGLDLGSRETRLDIELALRILGPTQDIHDQDEAVATPEL